MSTDPTTIVSKQVRTIFPDGLPRGLDPGQVKLVVNSKADAPVRELAPQPVQPSERSAGPDKRSPAVPPNEPEPAAAEACPPAPLHGQNDSVPPPSPYKLSRAEAARENGRKSRGPVTPEGKARSSQNALKHGLSSRRVVIGTEDEEEWLEFRHECRETLQPVGAIELGYADEFAASRWRLQRCLGIETSIFDNELAMQKTYVEERRPEMDNVAKTGLAFRAAKDNLTALGRYETRIRRSGERALANLLKFQSMRRGADARSGAGTLACEPAPQPVQPSERSASVLQNEPEIPPAPADSTGPPTTQAPAADLLQNEPKQPAAADDFTEPTPAPQATPTSAIIDPCPSKSA